MRHKFRAPFAIAVIDFQRKQSHIGLLADSRQIDILNLHDYQSVQETKKSFVFCIYNRCPLIDT